MQNLQNKQSLHRSTALTLQSNQSQLKENPLETEVT